MQAANALSKQKMDDEALDSVEVFQESLLSELMLAGPEVSHPSCCFARISIKACRRNGLRTL